MSFSSDIKTELTTLINDNRCCDVAQMYGMLEFGHAFSFREITLQTENEAVAQRYADLLQTICCTEPLIQKAERSSVLTVTVAERDIQKVLSAFGHEREVSVRLNRANLDCESCAAAYVRGAFLVCGTVTNPEVDYHLEFSVPYYNLCRDLMTLLGELGLLPKCVKRKGNYVVYFKESEQIEDCLTLMGAFSASLELMNVKMIKDIRNRTNRVANCENANIDKVVLAALAQTEAVKRIDSTVGIDSLPQELQELCRLRLENPDFSLRELGENLEPPLTRSGVNHRFQRILEIAENL